MIQVAELESEDGQVVCNRGKPAVIKLDPPNDRKTARSGAREKVRKSSNKKLLLK